MMIMSFYDPNTGIFVRRKKQFPNSMDANKKAMFIKTNTPPGLEAIEGHFDHLSQRVDVATGEVVDYQPPQPSPEHEWKVDIKRWVLSKEATARNAADIDARRQLAAIDQQLVRYLADIDDGSIDAEGRLRYQELKARKADLRTKLKR